MFQSSCTSTSLSDLREKLDTAETSLYVKEQVTGAELEPTVKNLYRDFLQSASLAQKDRIDSYFHEWRIVGDVNGPFETTEKQKKAFDAISQPSDFHAGLFMEQLLENRDDSEEFIALFRETMISPDTVKLQLYFTGDGDIINSVIVASLKNSGELYAITSIYD